MLGSRTDGDDNDGCLAWRLYPETRSNRIHRNARSQSRIGAHLNARTELGRQSEGWVPCCRIAPRRSRRSRVALSRPRWSIHRARRARNHGRPSHFQRQSRHTARQDPSCGFSGTNPDLAQRRLPVVRTTLSKAGGAVRLTTTARNFYTAFRPSARSDGVPSLSNSHSCRDLPAEQPDTRNRRCNTIPGNIAGRCPYSWRKICVDPPNHVCPRPPKNRAPGRPSSVDEDRRSPWWSFGPWGMRGA